MADVITNLIQARRDNAEQKRKLAQEALTIEDSMKHYLLDNFMAEFLTVDWKQLERHN